MTERDVIDRKIFLKRQLIEVTEKEIAALEHKLINPGDEQVALEAKT